MQRFLLALRSRESSVKLVALSELCEVLSLATEDLLHSFPPRELAQGITEVLRDDSTSAIPHIKLMAIRCLNNFMAALPSTVSKIASVDVIAPLCDSVRSISYIDVAEEALLALGRIANLHALPVLQAGGLSAILTNLMFFPIRVQHSAMETAAKLVLEINFSQAKFVVPCIPQIGDLLNPGDIKVQTQAIAIWATASCALAGHKGFERALLSCKSNLLPKLLDVLANQAQSQQGNSAIGSTSRQIFRALTSLCKHSSKLGEALINATMRDLPQKDGIPAIASLISKLLDPADETWVSAEKLSGIYSGAISDILQLAVELCSQKLSGGEDPRASRERRKTKSRGKRKRPRAKLFRGRKDSSISSEVKGSGKFQLTCPLSSKRKTRLRDKVISAARTTGQEEKNEVGGASKDILDDKDAEIARRHCILAITVAPAFIRIGRNCDQEEVQSLCVEGLKRAIHLFCRKTPTETATIVPSDLPNICDLLIQLLRSGIPDLVCSAIKISLTLLECESNLKITSDEAACESFRDLFVREGVFATISELSKENRPSQDAKFSFLSISTRDISKPSTFNRAKLEAERFIRSWFKNGGDVEMSKVEDKLLMHGKLLRDLAESLGERTPTNNRELKKRLLEGVKGYKKDASILENIGKRLSATASVTTYELLSSGLVQKLSRYLCADSPCMPKTFDILSSGDPTSERKYIRDSSLILRRANVLDTLLAEDSEPENDNEALKKSCNKVPTLVERLIRALETVESFRVRLDRLAASDCKLAVDTFAKPIRLNITTRKTMPSVNIKGQFAVDPLTTIESIAKFLTRQHPSLLLPQPQVLSQYFTASKKKSLSSSSRTASTSWSTTRRRKVLTGQGTKPQAKIIFGPKQGETSASSSNPNNQTNGQLEVRRSSRLRNRWKYTNPASKSMSRCSQISAASATSEAQGQKQERQMPTVKMQKNIPLSTNEPEEMCKIFSQSTTSSVSNSKRRESQRSKTRSGVIFRMPCAPAHQDQKLSTLRRSKRKLNRTAERVSELGVSSKVKRQRLGKRIKRDKPYESQDIKGLVTKAKEFAVGGHVEIRFNGHEVPPSCTVFEAVRRYGIQTSSSSSSIQDCTEGSNLDLVDAMRAWETPHKLTFQALSIGRRKKRVADKPIVSEQPELETHSNTIKDLIMLLRILYRISLSRNEILDARDDILFAESRIPNDEYCRFRNARRIDQDSWTKAYSAKLSGKLIRQLSDPMIVCSSTGFSKVARHIGIPEWGHWLARQTPFLLSPAVRYLYFRVTGFGPAQHLTSINNHLKSSSSNGAERRNATDPGIIGNSPSVPLEYRVKHVKVFCRRANTLEAACQLLDHHAAERCSIRAEFIGENGVGLGPTVEFFSLASRELQLKDLDLWREANSNTSSQDKIHSDAKNHHGHSANQKSNLENDALHFVIQKCLSCLCVILPICPEHNLLFTRICQDGSWACAERDCGNRCSSLRGTANASKNERAAFRECQFCSVGKLELEEWGLTTDECKYLANSYPKGIPAFPHLSLKCHSCECINFPGNNGVLHANSGGRMVSKDCTLVSEINFRNAFVHALKCCSGSLLHQHPLILLEKEFVKPLVVAYDATRNRVCRRNTGRKRRMEHQNERKGHIEDSFNDGAEYVQHPWGLFPAGISNPSNNDSLRFASSKRRENAMNGDQKATLRSPMSLFTNVGRLIGQAVSEERVLDADFSPALMHVLAGGPPTESQLDCVDPDLQKTLKKLRSISRVYRHRMSLLKLKNEKRGGTLGKTAGLDLKLDGCSVKDLSLSFVAPGSTTELLPNGENTPVTLDNLENYLHLVYSHILDKSVGVQMSCIRDGFKEICSPEAFSVLTLRERARLVGGENGSGKRQWDFSIETLKKSVVCDQGYNHSSRGITYFFEILSEMDADKQQAFVRYLTGCPRLPAGQIASLRPRITVVRVPWDSSRSKALPLASTCTNYLKLPDYPTKELMRERIYYSISECPYGFQLS